MKARAMGHREFALSSRLSAITVQGGKRSAKRRPELGLLERAEFEHT